MALCDHCRRPALRHTLTDIPRLGTYCEGCTLVAFAQYLVYAFKRRPTLVGLLMLFTAT